MNGFTVWVFISFVLALIPNISPASSSSRIFRQKLLLYFQAAQAALLVTYTLAGIWKIRAAISQAQAGEIYAFSKGALEHITATIMVQSSQASLLGPQILDFPRFAQTMHISALAVEIFALPILFLYSAHRYWGILLCFLHLGTKLLFNIPFAVNIPLIVLFLIMSPFFEIKRTRTGQSPFPWAN